MNCDCSSWLPPDGDSRLVRFQQELARLAGLTNGPWEPVRVELTRKRVPRGPVRLGSWTLCEDEPVLEAIDTDGVFGLVWFGLGRPAGWQPRDLEGLPSPPPWTWARGVIVDFHCDRVDQATVFWSWGPRKGWKADAKA